MSEKKKRPSPAQSAAATKVGTVMLGGNGTLWEVVKVGTVHRWVPHEEMVHLDNTEFRVYRNVSLIAPQVSKKLYLDMGTRGSLLMSISSRYVPEANGVIHSSLQKIKVIYKDGMFAFTHDGSSYLVITTAKKAKQKMVNEILAKFAKPVGSFPMDDYKPVLRGNHIGTLLRLTPKIIGRLTPGKSYYIVSANGWFKCYNGDVIEVWKYPGGKLEDVISNFTTQYWTGKKIAKLDHLYIFEDGYLVSINGDPVYIVQELRRGVKAPGGLTASFP